MMREVRQGRKTAGGMVLIIVLVAIAMLSLAAYTFTELMLSENKAARLVTRESQARALTESAAEMVRLYLAQTPQSLLQAGGTYSNAALFQGVQVVPVIDDGVPRNRGRFTVIAPLVEQGQVTGVRFGLENESSRLNLNTLLFIEKQTSGSGLLSNLGSGTSSGGSSQSQGSQQSTGTGSSSSRTSNNSSSTDSSTGSARGLLMALPGMTEETADAILDWIDEDDEPREFGAEIDDYANLGYAPKNGPLDTLEELLLVRGVTPQLLFGADSNRNGIVDPGEQPRAFLSQATSSDPEVDRGWAPYLTLYSKEANVQPDGTPRIDLNSTNLQSLHDQLATAFNTEWANFIVVYRQFGPYSSGNQDGSNNDWDDGSNNNPGVNGNPQTIDARATSPFRLAAFLQPGGTRSGGAALGGSIGNGNGGGNTSRGSGNTSGKNSSKNSNRNSNNNSDEKLEQVSADSITIDFNKAAKYPVSQILDLIGVKVKMQIPPPEGSKEDPEEVLVKCPFPDDPGAAATYLPLLMDHVTVNPATTIPGRININQASRVVLQGIPGMDAQTLEAILGNREPEPTAQRPNRIHETWLYSEGYVDLDTMREMMPFITGAGNVYRAQIVGYFDQMGPAHRVEAVIDATNATVGVPRIVFWRDISNLGRAFGLDTLGAGPVQ